MARSDLPIMVAGAAGAAPELHNSTIRHLHVWFGEEFKKGLAAYE
jgi:hypothetical protein